MKIQEIVSNNVSSYVLYLPGIVTLQLSGAKRIAELLLVTEYIQTACYFSRALRFFCYCYVSN